MTAIAARHHVVITGTGGATVAAALTAAGYRDFAILDTTPKESVFDDRTHTWSLRTAAGRLIQADVVVATQPPLVPWTPELVGHNDFRGNSFHAAEWDPQFDASGKHIAVIGADATAGHHIPAAIRSAASVTVFAHAPRRVVGDVPLLRTRAARWLRHRALPLPRPHRPAANLVGSAIDAVTPSGLRTKDGVHHHADVIVYGTGFTTSDETLIGSAGVTLRQTWVDGMEPYLGVAVRGFPNQFFITGPDVDAQTSYIIGVLGHLRLTGATRIEVRRSSQRVFNDRVYCRPVQPHAVTQAYEMSSDARDSVPDYDGAATLTIGDTPHPVRVRLAGHLDPIDGQYHWQGTVVQPQPDGGIKPARAATLTVGARSAPARIVELTPWGTHSISGVGAPPYQPEPAGESPIRD